MFLRAGRPISLADAHLTTLNKFHGQCGIVLISAVSAISACLLIYSHTENFAFIYFAVAFLALSLVRLGELLWAEKDTQSSLPENRTLSEEINRPWTIIISLIASATMGGLCFYSICIVQNIFAVIASLSLASVAGIFLLIGSHSQIPLLYWRIAIGALPITVALALHGTFSSFSLMYFVALYVIGLIWIAWILQAVPFAKMQKLSFFEKKSQSLDTALNTIPQGVIIFDADYKISFINAHARKLLQMETHRLIGRDYAVIIRYFLQRNIFPGETFAYIRSRVENLLKEKRKQDILQISTGQYIECSVTISTDGNIVLVIDDVTTRIKNEEQIQYLAHYDALTSLPNRAYFDRLIKSVRMNNKDAAWEVLIVIDIQQLKRINEAYGHLRGDEALQAFARKLLEIDANQCIVSRFGSDEFVLYIKPLPTEPDIDCMLERVFETVTGLYTIGNMKLDIDIRVGVVVSDKKQSLTDLHMKAGLALTQAKTNSEKPWVLYEDYMDKAYRKNRRLRQDLKKAVADNALEVYYQPIVSTRSLRIVAYEALSRWKHPELGYVSPSEFMPLAEEIGLISQITEYVLRRACLDCVTWPKHINVSVNLSVLDLENDKIVEVVQQAVKESLLEPKRLELEVTESAVIRDQNRAVPILLRLRALGVSIALDDFGTGYSSLSYLNVLPLTKIKIDRAFVHEISSNNRSLMLLRGIAHLSRELGLGVTVEGIETEEQLAIIRSSGAADLLQGFLLGRPAPYLETLKYHEGVSQ